MTRVEKPSVPPSLIGTQVGTFVGILYVILISDDLKLWSLYERLFVIGGAALVLATYSVSSTLLESDESFKESIRNAPRLEYWMRVISQTLLALSIGFVGINLGYYFVMFALFLISTFVWSVYVAKRLTIRPIGRLITHETVNLFLCLSYAFLALYLYGKAADFEKTYPIFILDQPSFQNRRTHMVNELREVHGFLMFSLGAIFANLVTLVAKSPWISRWSQP